MRVLGAIWKLLTAAAALAVLGIAALVVLVVVAIAHVAGASGKNASKITPATYRAVRIGTSASTIRRRFGKPILVDSTTVLGRTETCWHYGYVHYVFCFENGLLVSKERL